MPGIIDVWSQPVIHGTLDRLPVFQRLLQQSGMSGVLEQGISPEEMLTAMDQAGIERVLFSAWYAPQGPLISNDQIAALCRVAPSRFLGMAGVPLDRPLDAVRELERAVNELGMKALRLIPWLWNLPPNDKHYYPLYVKCIELGIPFCTQVGHTGPLMPSEPGRPIPYIDEIALTFPDLKIVGGHIGYPWTDEMIAVAWKHANVYIDTSAYLPRYYPPTLLHFMKTYGQDKVLFGTNFPMLPWQRCAEQAASLELPPSIAEKFLRTNAERVFGI